MSIGSQPKPSEIMKWQDFWWAQQGSGLISQRRAARRRYRQVQ
jgi:hypothetical protein